MAPTMTDDNTDFKADWHCSSLHERLISPGPKEEKVSAYAEWANTYDREVTDNNYRAPTSVAKILFDILDKDASFKSQKSVSVVDAGCGTGLTVEELIKIGNEKGVAFDMVGLDFSPEMLDLAEKKKVYSELQIADLNDPMPIGDQKFDFAIATGVFLEGHCGPPALVNVLDGIAPGRYAVISVRNESFKPKEAEYMKVISNGNCKLLENLLMPYLGPVVANYLIIKKSN